MIDMKSWIGRLMNRFYSKEADIEDEAGRIKEEVKNLNPWFYELEINGIKVKPGVYPSKKETDMNTAGLIYRQKCRKTLLIDGVTKRFDFKGARILDVACNCGYWSSIYIKEYGADSVVGLEGRELFIKQGDLYYNSLGIRDKARFIQCNVTEYNIEKFGRGTFDFVLCSGILYHIKDHEEFLKKLSYVNKRVMVIDTRVSEEGEELIEPDNLYFNAIEETLDKKVPKRDDLISIMTKLGYKIEIIPPKFKTKHGISGNDDYNAGKRVCLFCRRKE